MTNFAWWVRENRRRCELTRAEFGAPLGVSARTVAAWENGERLPSVPVAVDLDREHFMPALEEWLDEVMVAP